MKRLVCARNSLQSTYWGERNKTLPIDERCNSVCIYRIVGNFWGTKILWLSLLNQFVEIFSWLLVDETTPVQDMNNSWVKYSCSGIEPRKPRNFVSRNLPAILCMSWTVTRYSLLSLVSLTRYPFNFAEARPTQCSGHSTSTVKNHESRVETYIL